MDRNLCPDFEHPLLLGLFLRSHQNRPPQHYYDNFIKLCSWMPNITGLKQEEELEVIIALSKWKDKLKYIMIQEANNAAALLLSKQIMSDEDLILCVNSLVNDVGAMIYEDFFLKTIYRKKIDSGSWNMLCDMVYEETRMARFPFIPPGLTRASLYAKFKIRFRHKRSEFKHAFNKECEKAFAEKQLSSLPLEEWQTCILGAVKKRLGRSLVFKGDDWTVIANTDSLESYFYKNFQKYLMVEYRRAIDEQEIEVIGDATDIEDPPAAPRAARRERDEEHEQQNDADEMEVRQSREMTFGSSTE